MFTLGSDLDYPTAAVFVLILQSKPTYRSYSACPLTNCMIADSAAYFFSFMSSTACRIGTLDVQLSVEVLFVG
jgi:hypothetical protein